MVYYPCHARLYRFFYGGRGLEPLYCDNCHLYKIFFSSKQVLGEKWVADKFVRRWFEGKMCGDVFMLFLEPNELNGNASRHSICRFSRISTLRIN